MKTFIRATEVWVPTGDRALLELAGGLYGTASQFGAISLETAVDSAGTSDFFNAGERLG